MAARPAACFSCFFGLFLATFRATRQARKAKAKKTALDILSRHPVEEDSWWKGERPHPNVHPATEKRIEHIQSSL